MRFYVLAALLLVSLSLASATTPQSWATATPGVYVPPCNAQGPKHWETEATDRAENQVLVYDAYRASGYVTLKLRYDSGSWILGGECTLAS